MSDEQTTHFGYKQGPVVRIPEAALAAAEQVVNGYLALDPEGAQRLAALHGRAICIELAGFGARLYLIPGPAGIQLFGDYVGTPDCVLRGTPLALARMGAAPRKEDQLFSGAVQVEGDTRLAQEFGDLIAGLEVDWEEQLARLIGDPIAHRVGSGVRTAGRWVERTRETLTLDLKEYLQEEGRLAPTRYEVQEFMGAVDTLRDDAERLAARVERIGRHLGGAGGER